MGVIVVFWTLWKTRNTTIFDHIYPSDPIMVVYKLSHWIKLWSGLQKKENNWRYRDQDGRKLTLDNFYGLLLWPCCSLRFAIIDRLLIYSLISVFLYYYCLFPLHSFSFMFLYFVIFLASFFSILVNNYLVHLNSPL